MQKDQGVVRESHDRPNQETYFACLSAVAAQLRRVGQICKPDHRLGFCERTSIQQRL